MSDRGQPPVQPGQVGTRRVHTGRVLNLDIDQVRFPDGSVGELEIIRHPGASAIVPIVGAVDGPDPELVLIRQYRYAASGYVFEIPAGRLNDGESPAECAERELVEETGFSAGRMDYLYTMFTTPGFTDEKIHVFRAGELTVGETAHEPDEFMSIVRTPLSKALEMIKTGEICDAKTALAILYAAAFGLNPGSARAGA
ncbi:MAG: NUDIX hydrolase [Gemmatimonadota bacterium]|nr:NUDIX hydrolase [Gemmatimonadota bacterium]